VSARDAAPRRPSPQPSLSLLSSGEPAPEAPATLGSEGPPPLEEALAAGAAVYEVLLSLCRPDARALADLEALGVSRELALSEGFGALYPGEFAAGLLSSLRGRFEDATLLRTPGFVDGPAGTPRLEAGSRPLIEHQPTLDAVGRAGPADPKGCPVDPAHHEGATGGDERFAPFALVPYRDAHGRILALESIDLWPGAKLRSVLLGCGKEGRDPRLGGANHLWAPRSAGRPPQSASARARPDDWGAHAGPRAVRAVTDNLLEALRATSAGIACASIRSPRAHHPGAGRDALPELRGVELDGRRILYAPSPSARARSAALKAADAVLSRAGAAAFVLGKPPYKRPAGLGSFLLSLEPKERNTIFAGLLMNAEALPVCRPGTVADAPGWQHEGAPTSPASGPAAPNVPSAAPASLRSAEPEATAGVPEGGEGTQNLVLADLAARRARLFEEEMAKAPAMPERGRLATKGDLAWAKQAGAFVFAAVFAPCVVLAGLASAFFGLMARSAATLPPATSEPPMEPLRLMPWFLARVSEPMGLTLSRLAEILSPVHYWGALLAMLPATAAAAFAAVAVAEIKRRQRIARIKVHQGRYLR